MSKNEQNEQIFFICKICNYKTCKKNNFNRHNSTQKHIRNHLAINGNKNEQNEQNKFSCTKCSFSHLPVPYHLVNYWCQILKKNLMVNLFVFI